MATEGDQLDFSKKPSLFGLCCHYWLHNTYICQIWWCLANWHFAETTFGQVVGDMDDLWGAAHWRLSRTRINLAKIKRSRLQLFDSSCGMFLQRKKRSKKLRDGCLSRTLFRILISLPALSPTSKTSVWRSGLKTGKKPELDRTGLEKRPDCSLGLSYLAIKDRKKTGLDRSFVPPY